MDEKEGCCGGHCACGEEQQEAPLAEGRLTESGPAHELDVDEEEMDAEDLADSNNIILSGLIEILIKKGVLTQEELDEVVEEIMSEDDEADEEAPDEEEGEHTTTPGV